MRQDKWLGWAVAVFLLALLAFVIVDHTMLIDAWTVNGGPANLNQVHAWCSANNPGLFGPTSVSVCHAQLKWVFVAVSFELLALAALLTVGFRAYWVIFHKARAQQRYRP